MTRQRRHPARTDGWFCEDAKHEGPRFVPYRQDRISLRLEFRRESVGGRFAVRSVRRLCTGCARRLAADPAEQQATLFDAIGAVDGA